MNNLEIEQENTLAAIKAQSKLLDAIVPKHEEPKLSEGGRETRTMPFRFKSSPPTDFVVTYKIDVNGDTELWSIKSEDDLLEVLRNSVLDEADNQIARHASDNPKA